MSRRPADLAAAVLALSHPSFDAVLAHVLYLRDRIGIPHTLAEIGVDDARYGQRLAAFVVLEDDAATDSDGLKNYVRENLANFKVPREIRVLEELPRSSTGKIVRRDLAALLG